MGTPRHPEKIKLVVSLFFGDAKIYEKARKDLVRKFGVVDFESNLLDFTHTSYYEGEMGSPLKRKILSFRKLFNVKSIFKVKVITNSLERKYSHGGKRAVNIDPGYLTLSKLILFSTKDYTHRIYLDKGIFAEVTLFYKDGRFNGWPWSYPDYKSTEYSDIFENIRRIYNEQITK